VALVLGRPGFFFFSASLALCSKASAASFRSAALDFNTGGLDVDTTGAFIQDETGGYRRTKAYPVARWVGEHLGYSPCGNVVD
jgi:hypothetical protein